MGKTIALDINGNPNVGLYAYASDNFCLIGKGIPDEDKEKFAKALDVPLIDFEVGNSSQVGVYAAGNSSIVLFPDLIKESEKKILDDNNINYAVIETKESALGNNLVISDNYFYYNPSMEKEAIKQIKEATGLEGEPLELEDWEVAGSIVKVTSQGGLIQNEVPDELKEKIEKDLKVKLEKGTLNFGSPTISGCVVVNKNGMVVGKASAGIEITNADLAFGFLE